MKYSPQLDGLRAIAILAVLVFHVWPGSLRGGFTGVDVFFVLSGYLITSVVLHDVRGGSFRLREFYLRRIQRLFPNAVLTVLVTAVLAWLLLLPSAAVKVGAHGLWTLFEASNFYIRSHVGGYWGDVAGTNPLLHTWSLAVEEQFYLVFPWLLVWLVRRRQAHGAFAVLTAGSLALCLYATWKYPVSAFYMLPPRGWELLLGALLALRRVPATGELPVEPARRPAWRELVGWLGVALMLTGFVVIRDERGFPGWVALLPALGALAVIVAAAGGQGTLARWLAHPFMVVTGKLSYSLYLWHWPLIVIGREFADLTGQPTQTGAYIGAAASVGVSALVYRFVEVPLRRRDRGRGRRVAIIAGLFVSAVAVCVALVRIDVQNGSRSEFNRPSFGGQAYNQSAAPQVRNEGAATRLVDVDFATVRPPGQRAWRAGGIVHAWGSGAPRVVVLGSSHALMYAALIDSLCRERRVPVAFFTTDGAATLTSTLERDGSPSLPAPGMVQEFVTARRRWIRDWQPAAVFVIDRWDRYQSEPAHMASALEAMVLELGADTRRIVIPTQVPVVRLGENVNLRELVVWFRRLSGTRPALAADALQPFRDSTATMLESTERAHPAVQVLRLDPLFRERDGSVRYAAGREFFYLDDDHLTDSGARVTRPLFAASIDSALVRR